MTLNRLGSPSQEHRPLTPYERGQMLTHYPTVGPTEMARRLHRSIASIKYHWAEIRPKARTQPCETGNVMSYEAA